MGTLAYEMFEQAIASIEEKIGYVFQDKGLLTLAFTHRSFFNEQKAKVSGHNERLEFLGDAVLGLVISAFLYSRFPQEQEGVLSNLRSRLVDSYFCSAALRKLGLDKMVLLGKGEAATEGRSKDSIAADAFEALVGALYLDGGYPAASSFLLTHFQEEIETVLGSPHHNYKAELQDFTQKKFQKTPSYKVLKEEGPDHAKIFQVAVFVHEEEVGRGEGASKRQAEQMAAQKALENWK